MGRAMSARAAGLDVRVRLLTEPCLWCWEIVDRRHRGALVESSWAREWTAYESQDEALALGRARLAELGVAGGERGRRGKGASTS